MNQGKSALLSVIIGVILLILAVKLLGAMLKVIGILAAIAIAAAVYFVAQRQIGGRRAP